LTMLLDYNNKYYVAGQFQYHSISCMLCSSHSRARNSPCFDPHPYLTINDIAAHIDLNGPNDPWYSHIREDLHFQDFLYQAQMQTAWCLTQCVTLFPSRNRVSECLLVDGTLDHDDPHSMNTAEEFAMQHVSVVGLCLLARIEMLESWVCGFLVPTDCWSGTYGFCS
jgi:hypothetical protein